MSGSASVPLIDIEDAAQLRRYLIGTGRMDAAEPFQVEVLSGGVSNRTVLLRHPPRRPWVLKQALPKLRVQVDWFSPPDRIHREALGLRLLRKLLGPHHIPALIFEDPQQHLLAMYAVATPHENWKQRLLAGGVARRHVVEFARMLASIHVGAWKRAAEWQPLLQDKHFFDTLRLEPYYEFTATQVPEAAPFLRQLVEETRAAEITAVHGDYSPKNVLLRNDRLVLLDHEVLHWGDPAFDVGFALTHLLSKAHHLDAHRRRFVNAASLFWNTYQRELHDIPWARDISGRAARHLLGCLLARVAGRSPLEYLSAQERYRQRQAVLCLLEHLPGSVDQAIADFAWYIESIKES